MPKVAKDDLELLPCGVKMESAEGEEPRLGDLPELFRKCIRENPADINARYNLGVALAWLGNNKESIATLDEFIRESNDPNLFRRAATLVEVLKFSAGMENESDYINYHLGVPLSNPETVGTWLNELQQTRRILPLFQDKQTGSITFFMLEESASGLITTGSTAKEFSKVIGYLALYPATLVAWSYDAKKIENLKLELLTKLQVPLNQVITSTNISDFAGILLPSAVIPLGTKDKDKARKIAHDQMVAYFDNTWLSQPRKSLGGKTPSDAASDAFLGKKLQGLLDLYEEVVATQDASLFSFDDLRKKLNLGGKPQLSSENSPVKTENTSGGPQSLDGHLDAFRKALTAEDKAQAFENANSAINLGIAPSHPSYVAVVRFLADYHAEQQNVSGMKSLLTKAIADSTGEGLETQANDLKVLEIKMLGKCKDVDGLKLLLESFLSKPSEEDKLFVAFAETCMRINLKDQA
ncbi:MAG: tetratricopeptide repeat protein, partial [Gemmataceae bacterium]